MSKLYEIFLAGQINEYIAGRGLMTPIQSAYRPAHSTTLALLKIASDINRALDKKLVFEAYDGILF